MKNPLRYQMTEYDCGPTSLLNAVSFLFEREAIPPEIVRNIMLYCLDRYGADGASGKRGTSRTAMMFLSHWLDGFGEAGHLSISSRYLRGGAIHLRQDGLLRDTLNQGGVVVARVDLEGWHYVLLTGLQDRRVRLFDPYYRDAPFEGPYAQIELVTDHPGAYNRIVPVEILEQEALSPYALGPVASREAVLLFNERTKLTAEKTVEYMI